MYFSVPWAEPLVAPSRARVPLRLRASADLRRARGHGRGLHVAALTLEDEAKIGATGAVLSVAIPFAIYVAMFYALYSVLMRASTRSTSASSRARPRSWSCRWSSPRRA